MEPNSLSDVPEFDEDVLDCASLYLCRQGASWVAVIDSPRIRAAVRLRHAGRDSFDARFELLCKARRACPAASIICTDGALEGADYEWRLDIASLQPHAGDLGVAIHRELSAREPRPHVRRLNGKQDRRHCVQGRHPSCVTGRPRAF